MVPIEERKIFNIANKIAWNFYKTNSTFTFDEIQSTAYMGLVKGLNSYKEDRGKKLSSWVYSKIKWEILDMFEEEKRFQHISLYETDEDNYSLEERLGTEEFEEELLNQVLIKKALTALTSEEIKLIYLKFYKGLSYSEIANVMKSSSRIVGLKMTKALNKMRNKLNERELENKYSIRVSKARTRNVESINTNKDYIVMRVKAEAQYIIDNQSTIRDTAKAFGVGKTTVHVDLIKRLPKLDKTLFDRVCMILDYNTEDRANRGGESTKRRYKEKAYSLTDQSIKNKH